MVISFRKVKKRTLICTLFFVAILGTLCFFSIQYCDMTDYAVYYREYNSLKNTGTAGLFHSFEPGYRLLEKLFIFLGANFSVFYGVIVTAILLLLGRFIYKYTELKTEVLLLFCVFPFINCLQQIRSALGVAIILNATGYLLKEGRKSKLKYALVVIMTSSLQITNIIYLVFLLAVRIDFSKLKRIVFVCFFAFSVLFFVLYKFAYKLILGISAFQRIQENLVADKGFSYLAICNLIAYFLLFFYIHILTKGRLNKLKDNDIKLLAVSITVCLISTFTVIADSAYRLSAMQLPLVYVSLLNASGRPYRDKRFFLSAIVLAVFAIGIFLLYWGPTSPRMNYILHNVMWKQHP